MSKNAWSKPLSKNGAAPNKQDKISAPPGLSNKPSAPAVNNGSASNKQDMLRERFLHLQLSLLGHNVSVSLTDGAIIEGVLHTFTPFSHLPAEHRNKYVIKAAKITKGTAQGIEGSNGGTMIIPCEKVAQVYVKSLRLDHGHGSQSFRTDTDISSGVAADEKDLVMAGNLWTSSSSNGGGADRNGRKGMFGTMTGGTDDMRGNIGKWDQFQANESKFGVKATYDENLYTTSLDKSTVDKNKQREAERLAREIEGTATSNLHLAEERGQAVEGDYDEEDLYSGVLVTDSSGKQKERSKLVLKKRSTVKDEEAKKGDTTASPSETTAKSADPVASSTQKKSWAAAVGNVGKDKPIPVKKEPESIEVNEKKQDKDSTKVEKAPPKVEEESKKSIEETHTEKKDKPGDTKEESQEEKKPEKPKSTLNANAKSFTFNPSAKSFTPTFMTPTSTAPVQPTTQDPAMNHMKYPHYIQYPPQMQHGMHMGAPMMYSNYPPAMRYPGVPPYNPQGMQYLPPEGEQVGGEIARISAGESAATSTSTTPVPTEDKADEGGNDGQGPAASSAQQTGQSVPAHGPPMGYPGYYPGMQMPPGGRGTVQQPYPHPMGHPQNPGGPGRYGMPPQQHYQGNMPQYSMRGPGYPGASYMQGGYPYPMDEDYHGGGRGGRGRGGRGRGGPGRGGRGQGRGKVGSNGAEDDPEQSAVPQDAPEDQTSKD